MSAFSSGNFCQDAAPQMAWPIGLQRALGLNDAGLTLGDRTALVRRDCSSGELNLHDDRDRCLALLTVACGRPVSPDILDHVEIAAAHWRGGDKALANLRLVYAGFPRLDDHLDAHRLQAAGYLLDEGITPQDLMKELGFGAFALEKYDPDQPRFPAGSGRESGRWTNGTVGGQTDETLPRLPAAKPSGQTPNLIEVAANEPLRPGGINVVPTPPGDTLDPQGLNTPLSLVEQQAIANTVNAILSGQALDILTLRPHEYKNRPSDLTGAALPPTVGGYVTYYVRSPGAPAGTQRIIMDGTGHIYYTNNHYRSFYPVDIRPPVVKSK